MSLKLGIIRTSSIGDVILATACLDFVAKFDQTMTVIWVGRKPSISLLNTSWPNTIFLELRSGATRSERKKVETSLADCDVVIDLQNSMLSRGLSSFVRKKGKPVVVAKKMKAFRLGLVIKAFIRGRLMQLPSAVTTVPKYQYQMMLDALKDGLRVCGKGSSYDKVEGHPVVATLLNGQDNLLWRDMSFGRWLAVAPGASHAPKRAPTVVFQDTLLELDSLWGERAPSLGLVFVGSAEDRHAANELIDVLRWKGPTLNLAGKLSLEQSASVLSAAQALLSNDSGLAHIAEASGVPVAVLFGPTVESFGFAPWRPESMAHSSPVGCRPCSRHGKRPCRFDDQLCFQSINTRGVARHLVRVLGGLK